MKRFNADGLQKSAIVRESFSDLLEKLLQLLPPGRELAMVKTHLEDAGMRAQRALCDEPKNCLE